MASTEETEHERMMRTSRPYRPPAGKLVGPPHDHTFTGPDGDLREWIPVDKQPCLPISRYEGRPVWMNRGCRGGACACTGACTDRVLTTDRGSLFLILADNLQAMVDQREV